MKAVIAGASVLMIFMALLCLGPVAVLLGGDDSTCTGLTAVSGAAPNSAPPLNIPPGIHTSDMTWHPDQVHNAVTIISVGIGMGVPIRGWIIALAAAMQESHLVNLPDLGDANSADSLGLFQQRPSQGWGTSDQVMDPTHSATSFYQHLLAITGWQSMTVSQAAQAVQRSAFPNAYAAWERDATQLLAAIGVGGSPATLNNPQQCPAACPQLVNSSSQSSPDTGCGAGAAVLARAQTWLTAWDGGPVPYLSSDNPTTWYQGYRRDCSGYTSMALGLPGPGLDTAGLAARSTPIQKTDLRAGDLLINPAPDQAGHVVIFDHWTDTTMTSYIGYEQSSDGGTHHRDIPYPYFNGYQRMNPYRPN